MSEIRPPTRTCAMPRSSASCVIRSSRATSSETRPTPTVTAESPKNPLSFTPMSSETMSPSLSERFEGIPWTTCSFTDAHNVAGYPR